MYVSVCKTNALARQFEGWSVRAKLTHHAKRASNKKCYYLSCQQLAQLIFERAFLFSCNYVFPPEIIEFSHFCVSMLVSYRPKTSIDEI